MILSFLYLCFFYTKSTQLIDIFWYEESQDHHLCHRICEVVIKGHLMSTEVKQ